MDFLYIVFCIVAVFAFMAGVEWVCKRLGWVEDER